MQLEEKIDHRIKEIRVQRDEFVEIENNLRALSGSVEARMQRQTESSGKRSDEDETDKSSQRYFASLLTASVCQSGSRPPPATMQQR